MTRQRIWCRSIQGFSTATTNHPDGACDPTSRIRRQSDGRVCAVAKEVGPLALNTAALQMDRLWPAKPAADDAPRAVGRLCNSGKIHGSTRNPCDGSGQIGSVPRHEHVPHPLSLSPWSRLWLVPRAATLRARISARKKRGKVPRRGHSRGRPNCFVRPPRSIHRPSDHHQSRFTHLALYQLNPAARMGGSRQHRSSVVPAVHGHAEAQA